MEDENNIMQNLLDAGCPESAAVFAQQLYNSGQKKDALQAMKLVRCNLMDELHKSQRRVDCLDFLIRQTEKEIKTIKER